MGSNLAKAPLLAVLFAALYNFISALMPFSQGYKEAYAALITQPMYYVMLVVYGLWISVILALLFAHARGQKMGLLVPAAAPVLAFVCLLPSLEQIIFRTAMPILGRNDTWKQNAAWAISTILLLLLCVLLYRNDEPAAKQPGAPAPAQPKYKLKTLPLLVKCLAAPFAFMLLHFATWYLLGWRFDAVRMYYMKLEEAPANNGFVLELVDLLVRTPGQVPFALLVGFVVMVLGIPLLMQLPGKRAIFIGVHTMLCLCSGVYWMIPSVAYSQQVGSAQLLRYSVLFLLYGVLSGILLHTSLQKPEAPPQAQPAAQQGARPGQPGAKPQAAPARR